MKHPYTTENGFTKIESTAKTISRVVSYLALISLALFMAVTVYRLFTPYGILALCIVCFFTLMSYVIWKYREIKPASDRQAEAEEWNDARRQALSKHGDGENLK